MIKTIQLAGSPGGSGIESNIANVQVITPGKLLGIQYAILPNAAITGDDTIGMQISLVAVQQFSSNDVRGDILLNIRASYMFTTSGAAFMPLNGYSPIGIQLPGEAIIYLHVDALGTPDVFSALLFMEVK